MQLDHLEVEMEKKYTACLIEQTVPMTEEQVRDKTRIWIYSKLHLKTLGWPNVALYWMVQSTNFMTRERSGKVRGRVCYACAACREPGPESGKWHNQSSRGKIHFSRMDIAAATISFETPRGKWERAIEKWVSQGDQEWIFLNLSDWMRVGSLYKTSEYSPLLTIASSLISDSLSPVRSPTCPLIASLDTRRDWRRNAGDWRDAVPPLTGKRILW